MGSHHHSNKGCTGLIILLPPTVPEPPQLEPLSSPLSCEPITTSDSKESYVYIHKKTTYIHTQMSPSLATVEHSITKHCPILTGGDTTPQTLLLLENTFHEFFIAKTIPYDDCVKLTKVAIPSIR